MELLRTYIDVASPDELPPQARSLRERVPRSGELGECAGLHLDELQLDLGALRSLAKLAPNEEAVLEIPVPAVIRPLARQMAGLISAETREIIPHDWSKDILRELLEEL